jgi:hypothetical protein
MSLLAKLALETVIIIDAREAVIVSRCTRLTGTIGRGEIAHTASLANLKACLTNVAIRVIAAHAPWRNILRHHKHVPHFALLTSISTHKRILILR